MTSVLTGGEMLALDEAPGHLVRRAQQRHAVLWTREFGQDLDITGPQYALLCAVAAADGLDQGAAGERASLDKSSTADVVARLAGNGWLRVSPDVRDRRRKALSITPLARTALEVVTPRVAEVQTRLLRNIPTRDRSAFLDALRVVAYAGHVPKADSGGVGPFHALRDTPGHLLRRAHQVHTVIWGEEVGPMPTAPQYAVLSALWSHPAGIDQSTAGELASLDKSSIADVARRLVNRGWVSRERDHADSRRWVLQLTHSLREDFTKYTPAVRRVQERMLAPVEGAQQKRAFVEGCRALGNAD
ncbi:MarR family transcriptional regulator [Streptomyces bathyalis]|uniref:MarR family transcriptional regulator n=1 Tax=Streptomyces bathyalis TaxID=2710756 RepID=A0A7T1T2J8_9ACTN|nr:MarR family transcriptional regulator [Streptomyces bathyalis]QPP05233.1 MarR family transcriptional regulator [Streptomyces bathyalis]